VTTSPNKRAKRTLKKSDIQIGTVVKAMWGGKYYTGKIDKQFENGDYDVYFEQDNSLAKIKSSDIEVL
jgi:hypothetical protein